MIDIASIPEDPRSNIFKPEAKPLVEPKVELTAEMINAFLEKVDDVPLVGSSELRPLTKEEAATISSPSRVLLAYVFPHQKAWLRAEFIVSEAAIADPARHQEWLDAVSNHLEKNLWSTLPSTQQAVRRGLFKLKQYTELNKGIW